MELILEHDSFSRNVDQEITSIAIKEEYNFTFYNGNDIKGGRIISINGIDHTSPFVG